MHESDKEVVSKPWGKYTVLEQKENFWVKRLTIKKRERISLQSHKKRSEIWVVVSGKIKATKGNSTKQLDEGEYLKIDKEEKHRIEGIKESEVIEIALGEVEEGDITRFEDDYNRTT